MVTAHDHPEIEERIIAAIRDDLDEVNGRLNILEVMQRDIATLKLDVADLKTDVTNLKTDVAELKTGQAAMQRDIAEILRRLP